MGRLLITFLLCQRGALRRPLLYLSHYLKAHRAEYFDRLMAIRNDGDWEGWIRFFLRGVEQVSREATETAQAILRLREEHRQRIGQFSKRSGQGFRLLDLLYEHPIITVRMAEEHLGCCYATANKLVEQFIKLGLLEEMTGYHRNRRFRYAPYLALFRTSQGARETTPIQTAITASETAEG